MRRFMLMLLLLLCLLIPFGTTVLAQGQSDGFTHHYVSPGENLFRISLRYGVSMASIQAANPIIRNPNLIFSGTTLLIPTGGGTTPPVPGTPVPPQPQPGGEYVVVRGDTLGIIAARFGTTVMELARANNIVNINLIYPGQRLVIAGGGTTPVQPTPQPPVGPGPNLGGFELGGQAFGYDFAAEMRGAGMTWVKTQVVWEQGQPASIAQGAINDARSEGFKVLLSIKGNPEQLRANPAQYYQDFAAFLGGVAALGPDAIEVWNEQNIDREWPVGLISPASYTQMLSAAYRAIKGANNSVMVVSGAPAPTGFFGGACTGNGCDDDAFIRGMAANGAGNFMDCVGLHYNEGILSPDATSGDPRGNSGHYTRYYRSMVNLYSSVFPNRPLCFTELGYLSPEGYGPLPAGYNWAANTSVQDQAQWLARATQLAQQSGRVRLLVVWNVNATVYGVDPQAGYAIIRPDNSCAACDALAGVMN